MPIRIKDSQNVEPKEFHLLPIGNTESGKPENVSIEQIKNFIDEDKSLVAFTGDYSDLTNTPNLDDYATLNTLNLSYYNKTEIDEMIPEVYDSTITITQGGISKGKFSLNQSNNATIDLTTVVAQTQSNWEQNDSTADDYIKNKPQTRAFTITYDDETQETINFYIK